ncbi:hypothetical protein KY343_05105 [Candidatus Woesearchaeota archaeon]|nr:hypothetical protein [Candidatus Woesearchaeota archaeon]
MYYALNLPEFIDSKSIIGADGIGIPIDSLCLVDRMPKNIARYIYSKDRLRRLVETDFQEDCVWEPSSWLPNQGFFKKKSEEALRRGDTISAFENYIFWLHNRTEFSDGMQGFQKIARLTGDELDGIASPFRKDLTPYERDLIGIADSAEVQVLQSDLENWVISLRADKQVKKLRNKVGLAIGNRPYEPYEKEDYLEQPTVKEQLPLVRKIRDYSRERGHYKRAANMSRLLKEPDGELDDRVACFSQYDFATNAAKHEMIRDIFLLAQYTGREDVVDEWIDVYAQQQHILDGRFYDGFLGVHWNHTYLTYDHETGNWCEQWIEARPLLIDVALPGWPYKIFGEKGRFALACKLGEKTEINLEHLKRFREKYFEYDLKYDTGKKREKFDKVLSEAGIKF